MLAAGIGNYIIVPVHVPVGLALFAGWLAASALLLRRAVRPHLQRRSSTLGRCAATILMAAALAAFSGGVIFFLVQGIGKYFKVNLPILAVALAAVVLLAIGYVVLWTMLRLPNQQTLRIYAMAVLLPLVPLGLALIPLAQYTYKTGQQRIRENLCLQALQRVHEAIFTNYRGQPPTMLDQVVKDEKLRNIEILCPASPGRKSMYFYSPGVAVLPPGGNTRRLLACDSAPFHNGKWCVLFANGKAKLVADAELLSLLEDKENMAFKYNFNKTVTLPKTP